MIKIKNLYNYLIKNNFKKEAFFLEKKFSLKDNKIKQIPLNFSDSSAFSHEYEEISLDVKNKDYPPSDVTGSTGTVGPTFVYLLTSGNSDANFCKSQPAYMAAIIFVG